jgi:sialate O-acetylesterase
VKGNEVVVRFKHDHEGLKLNQAGKSGFAIREENGEWQWAKARIDGPTVVLSHPDIRQPVAVRYAWADNPVATLFNGAGMPAAPFRTDRAK